MSDESTVEREAEPASRRQPIRVLIVEDSALDAELMALELKRHGLRLEWRRVDSEAAFLEQLHWPPDLVLADYTMPSFGAVRALQLLQELALSIPLIVVSGTIGEEAAVAIVRLGASDYVLKDRISQLGRRAELALQGQRKIAYFSMEIALESAIPTYSGGLGVLAGDTIRSAADLQVPMVAVSLVHHAGYFRQRLDAGGWQQEEPVKWSAERFLERMPVSPSISLENRTVHLCVWKYEVRGAGGYAVPVYLLDTDLAENSDWDRKLTHALYGGDWYYRLCQEVVLGIGGVKALRTMGYDGIERFHMNEGHASLLTLALLSEQAQKEGRDQIEINDVAAVRQKCIFTTHTPVPAGHDHFPLNSLSRALWQRQDPSAAFSPHSAVRVFGPRTGNMGDLEPNASVDMTYLALNMSHYVNGVAKKHGEVSRAMFEGYGIDAITNGVHVATWIGPPMQALFDRYIPDWKQDNFSLRQAESIPKAEIWEAHLKAKAELIEFVNQLQGAKLEEDVLTIGFARRATAYKRPDLLFHDIGRLRSISRGAGRMQLVFAGKAHPSDQDGKRAIQRIVAMKEELKDDIQIVFVENYDMDIARRVVSGVDLWLNTPQPPLEASGTSGMKAALNGVPSLSILDGWWIEGLIEGITGWSIEAGKSESAETERAISAASLYSKLEQQILPMFYQDREGFIAVMKHAIALNGSFFNTQRMLQQYVLRAYFR